MENGLKFKRRCRKCSDEFEYSNNETFWDESGSCYSTKLVKCPNCGQINIIKYVEDRGLDVNNDPRYY